MDANLSAYLQAGAEQFASVVPQGFSVTVEVPPTTEPVKETTKFQAGQSPVIV